MFYDPTALYEKAEIEPPMEKENHLVIALSSDRGLCGGVHSNVTKAVKAYILEQGDNANIKIGIVGDKARLQLQRLAHFLCSSYNFYEHKYLQRKIW